MVNKGHLTKKDVDKEYYSYYLQLTNKGNRYLKNTGIFKVKFLGKEKYNFNFEILETTHKNKADLQYIIESYHAQSANTLFLTKEEAIKYHDKEVISDSKGCASSEDRLNMLACLIKQKTKEELALEWYVNLTEEQKEYVAIIKKEL